MNQERVPTDKLSLQEEACHLAQQLFGNVKNCTDFTDRLVDICTRAQGKDFLLIHNPGGWGNTSLERCMQWERSIVEGVSTTIERLGYTWLLTQHLRTGKGWRELMRDVRDQLRFFAFKAKVMAAELEFITRHINSLKIILIGISQGAGFNNAVMQHLSRLHQVYSVELGIFFLHRSQRVVTERTLIMDSNGLMPDAMMEWDIITMVRAFSAAPLRWVKRQLQRKPVKFTRCINVPGHDYNWDYPEVQQEIENFLDVNFGTKRDLREGLL